MRFLPSNGKAPWNEIARRFHDLSNVQLSLLLFAGALLVRLIYFFQLQSLPFSSHLGLDAASYDRMAMSIARGDWVGDAIFYQAPLYPYFLALLYKAFGHDLNIVRFVQLVLGAFNCVIIAWTARKLFDRKTAVWCGVLAAFYGIFVFYEGVIGKDGISIFVTDLALFGLVCSFQRPAWHRWFFSGIALGGAVLTRGNLVLLLPLVVFWMAMVLRAYPLRSIMGAMGALVVGAAVIISPVTVRNYVVGHDFVLTTSQAGQNFYIGNNPKASGFFENPERIRLNPKYEEGDFHVEALRRTGREAMKPSEVSSFWFKEGVRFIQQNPKRAMGLLAKKAAMFWNSFEIPDNYNYYFTRQEAPILSLLFPGFSLVAPLGLFGFFLARKRAGTWLFVLFTVGYMASIVPFHMASRYRLPVVPVLILFAAFALAEAARAVRRRDFKSISLALVPVGILAVGANWKVVDEAGTFKAPYTELGIIATEEGDFETALEHFGKALDIDPNYASALYNMGNVWARQGKFEEAVTTYQKAIRAAPENLLAFDNLGKSLIQLGRFDEALEVIDQALEIRPDFAEGLIGKGLVYHMAGRYEEAVGLFRKVIDLQPDSGSAYYNLACAYAKSGQVQKARAALGKAVELNPDYEEKAERDTDLEIMR